MKEGGERRDEGRGVMKEGGEKCDEGGRWGGGGGGADNSFSHVLTVYTLL